MGLTALIGGLAAAGPVPVFAIAGAGMRAAVQDLRLDPGVRIVDTPRAAAVLLIAGPTSALDAEALGRIHDALPHPRATVAWRAVDPFVRPGGGSSVVVEGDDPVPALRAVLGALLVGQRPSEAAILPDEDPADWRGVGPYGQGGSGMTGGTPYGRPMAELGPDRDGLRLDVLPVTLGPFFPRLPAGLVLDVKLAGDVVTEVAVATSRPLATGGGPESPFVRALSGPVSIAELELARAREHLRWLSDALLALGLPAYGLRALRLAHDVRAGDGRRVRAFAARIRLSGVFRWSLPRGGRPEPAALRGLGLGPIARAAGIAEDVRVEDAGYRALGFTPYLTDAGGPPGWWLMRTEEAARSLDLASEAGDRMTTLVGRVESPRGRLEPGDSPTARALALLPELLAGLEWGDAMATLVGLGLDLDEMAAVADADTTRASA
ncbi:MAG: hypothetical protein ACLGIJ_06510 [Candidatus Limnocylindria bacterium]